MKSFTLTPLKRAVTMASLGLVISGCSVTPQVMTKLENVQKSRVDLAELRADAQQIDGVVELNEAVARALKYNRSRRVSLMNTVLANNKLATAHFDMLPSLTAKAGYSDRSTHAVSSSGTYDENTQQLTAVSPPSYSGGAEKESNTHDLTLTWNVLDFGLSYVRAEQQADQALIAQERERKAIHNLIIDVRTAYWRAASAQKLLTLVTPLRERVRLALEDAKEVETLALQSPLQALTYQRDLLDINRSLQALHKDLRNAKTELATLMGLEPDQDFTLPDIAATGYEVLDVNIDVDTLENLALAQRPELKESRYSERITTAEGRAALLALLPSLNLNYAAHLDDNAYLLYDQWQDWGATVNVNLLNMFKTSAIRAQGEAAEAVGKEQRLALTAAVIGQVHLSLIAYNQAKEEFSTASEYLDVVTRINQQIQDQGEVGAGTELQMIREELNMVLATLRRDVAYGEVQNGYGRVFISSGMDPLPSVEDDSIAAISAAMAQQLEAWKDGHLGLTVTSLQEQVEAWKGAGDHSLQLAEGSFLLGGQVNYVAKLNNGEPLPDWLSFDPKTLTFAGNPPASASELNIDVQANNQHGTQANDVFSLALVNTNDRPQTDGEISLTFNEGDAQVTGNLSALDADGDALTFAVVNPAKVPPGFTFHADGGWSMAPDIDAWQHLKQDQKHVRALQVQVKDEYNGNAVANIKITITGTNDEPQATPVAELTLTEGDKPLRGQLAATDVDDGSSLTWGLVNAKIPAGFSLSRQGRYTFDPRVGEYDALSEGQYRSFVVVTEVKDEYGAAARLPLQFTLAGSNDAPVATHTGQLSIHLNAENNYTQPLPSNMFSDPESDTLTLNVALSEGGFATTELPVWLTYDADNQLLKANVESMQGVMDARLQITAQDPLGESVSSKLQVLVTP